MNTRIIGGAPTDIGEYPWQVAILIDSPVFSRQLCGGSLISDKHVITAASCVSRDRAYYVHLGDTILGNDHEVNYNKTILVANKYLHPDYDYPVNDIAILEMAEAVPLDQYPNIKPICLPNQGADFIGYNATLSGWGLDSSSQFFRTHQNYNSWLHEVNVIVLDDDECDDDDYIYHYDENDDYVYGVHSTQLCAGVLQGSEAPCYGDNGGPLAVSDPNVNNNGITLAGIIVYTGDCNLVEAYTKVSLYSDWINGIIGEATTCPPPPASVRNTVIVDKDEKVK